VSNLIDVQLNGQDVLLKRTGPGPYKSNRGANAQLDVIRMVITSPALAPNT
jgi:hypothetical protein